MKKLLVLLIVISFTSTIFAQQESFRWRIGIAGGYTSYVGDLNSNFFAAQPQFINPLDNLDLTSQAFSIEHTPNSALGIKLLISNGAFTTNDRGINWNGELINNSSNFERALNAKTEIQDASILATYYFDNGNILKRGSIVAPYIGLGIGITNFNVFADLLSSTDSRYYYWNDGTVRDADEVNGNGIIIEQDGTYETDVTTLSTEGTDYNTLVYHIPISFGLKFRVTEALNINIEWIGKYTSTDYLDDVSGEYQTFSDEFRNYASNPSGRTATWRGNENDNLNDIYGMVSLGIHYSFGKKLDAFLPPVFYTSADPITPNPLLPQVANPTTEKAEIEDTTKDKTLSNDKETREIIEPIKALETIKIDSIVNIVVDTQKVINVRTIAKIDTVEKVVVNEIRTIKIDTVYAVNDSQKINFTIDTTTQIKLDTQTVIVLDTNDIIDSIETIILDSTKVIKVDTVFSKITNIEKIDTVQSIPLDTQEVKLKEKVENIPVIADTIVSITEQPNIPDTSESYLDIFRVGNKNKTEPTKTEPTKTEKKTDETVINSNKPIDNNTKSVATKDTVFIKDTTVVLIETKVEDDILLALLNTRKEVSELTEATAENSEKSKKDSLHLLYLESQIAVLYQELEDYKQYNNNVAVRANNDFNQKENEQIRLMTDSLSTELERMKTIKRLEESKSEEDLKQAKQLHIEAAMQAQALEREIQKMNDKRAKKAEKEAERAKRQANRTTEEDWTSNTSRVAEKAKTDGQDITKNTEVNPTISTTKDSTAAVNTNATDSSKQEPTKEVVEPTIVEQEVQKKIREVEVKYTEQLVKKNEKLLEKQMTINKQEEEIVKLKSTVQQLENQQATNKDATTSENQVLQKQINELNKKMDEFIKAASTKPEPKVEPVVEPKPVVIEKPSAAKAIAGSERVNVYFDNGKTSIRSEFYNRLDRVASLMLQYTELNVNLQGFTDKSGNPEVNFKLSRARATAVKDYLMRRGINENRIDIDYFGDSKSDKQNDPMARRVEVILIVE